MNKIDEELISPIVEPTSEKSHRVTRAFLSAVPMFGGGLTEIFSSIITPPMELRKEKWMVQVTDAINHLLNSGFTLEQLQNNETFFSILTHASNVALKNHHEEKLVALRNCIVNSAVDSFLDESLQLVFVELIDTFTIWHIKVLILLQKPRRWAEENDATIFTSGALLDYRKIIKGAFPEMDTDIEQFVWTDLINKKLIIQPKIGPSLKPIPDKLSTSFGDRFIAFINET